MLAGVKGTDPFMAPERFVARLRDVGFAGVQNLPTVG